MSRKIIRVNITTKDDKNHISDWTANDIDLDSIKFNVDQVKKVTPTKEKETDTIPKKETTPKKSKKK